MTTIYDIAKKCHVSPSTVSKVINDYPSIPDETRERILKCMDDMNYIPNTTAKNLSKGRSYNVGVLACFGTSITPFKHMLFTGLLDSFQKRMNANNYDLLFVSRNVAGKNETFYKNCVSRHVDGVLLLGDTSTPELQEIVHSTLPRVGFDYVANDMSGVYSDNYEAMFELTEHLIYFGHKNIVFLTGESSSPITLQRVQGFKDALAKHDIEFYPGMLVETRYTDSDSVKSVVKELMSRQFRPTAIMCPDDLSAIESLNYLRELGFSCPKDISITGFDGIPFSQKVTPTLTTYKQETDDLGAALADSLLAQIANPKSGPIHKTIKGKLLIGESTGKPIPWK